jgi:ribonuclease BN (tRNA processing enzyme)
LKILFTGTGSGKTSLERYHSSLLISVKGFSLLVDSGDSVSRALLSAGISYNSLNGIVITHLHPDHFSGLASLIIQMKMTGRSEPLSVFVHQMSINSVKDFLSSSYVFSERLGFPLSFIGFEFDTEIMISDELLFIAKRNTHLDKYIQYNPELGSASSSLLFKTDDKTVFFSGDLGSEQDLYLFEEYPADLYITEVVHVSIEDVLEMMKKINPGKVILTHLADEAISEIRKKLNEIGGKRILIAEDGMNLSVRRYRS